MRISEPANFFSDYFKKNFLSAIDKFKVLDYN